LRAVKGKSKRQIRRSILAKRFPLRIKLRTRVIRVERLRNLHFALAFFSTFPHLSN